jgi:hypothetical protein
LARRKTPVSALTPAKLWKWLLTGSGAILLAVLSAWALFFAGPREKASPDVAVEFRRLLADYQTGFRDFGGKSSLLSTLWEVTISNSGDRTDSLTGYEVRSVQADGVMFYSGLDQGLLNQDSSPYILPRAIDPGHAERFLLKVGTMLSQGAYLHLSQTHQLGDVARVEAIYRDLYLKGIDVHGLPVVRIAEGAFSFPEAPRAPAVQIVLHMASGNTISAVAHWYPTLEQKDSR